MVEIFCFILGMFLLALATALSVVAIIKPKKRRWGENP